jgi:hypothetical protein
MPEGHDHVRCRWASPLRVMTAMAVACMLCVAMQDASASDANARAGTVAGNTTIQSFSKAKKLMRQVFAGHERTFYCDCAYDGTTVDFQSCGYQPKKHANRTRQLEWEHVVPADAFGQSFPEWREGHPACVDRKGKAFKGPPGTIGEKFTVSQHGHEDVSHEQSLLYMEKQRVVLYEIPCTCGWTAVLRRTIDL